MEDEESGIKALLTLTTTLLESANAGDANSLIAAVGHASGALAYLQTEVIGVERDHPIFAKALTEGSEMATVFASNFGDLAMPGIVWVSLHETSPEVGGVALLGNRERALIVDLHGDGVRININSVEFDIPDEITETLNFLGMWGSEAGDDLIEAGGLSKPLELDKRKHLTLGPGGLRLQKT